MEQKPTVGRIVHMRFEDQEPRALLVTAVNADGSVNGALFHPNGSTGGMSGIPPLPANGVPPKGQIYWAWPPRE